eukprot:TRINITY_DN3314_c0_g1_i5.p1 TRINITY_DN3314_c0_g1~~TRINITY_DN3314_c0_g1_i5.p1  ORF type:complete len:312 (-),score=55.88 TRINITY_DN3314_c0_g1_i5:18-953(-)
MKDMLNARLSEESKKIIKIPEFKRVESTLTIVEFVEKHQLPVVVKPTRGMGSINTYIIKSQEDYEKMLKSGVSTTLDGPVDFEVEKFVEGQMYHIDGYYEDGEVRLIWPSVYMNTCAGFENSKFLASYTLSNSNSLTKRLQEASIIILESLEKPRAFSFHIEIFHTPSDELVFCEAACRTGGAGVAGVTLLQFEVNLNKASTQAQCNDKVTSPLPETNWKNQNIPTQNAGWIVVYPKQGTIKSMPKAPPAHFDFIVDYEPTNRRQFGKIEHCTDALASLLVMGDNEKLVSQNILKAVQWIEKDVKWEEENN